MEELKKNLKDFVEKREWFKYHSPKNLAIGLSVEAAELLEIFIWLTEEESKELDKKQLTVLKEEIGDIMIYLINLAEQFDLDPLECAKQKLELNKSKYPSNLVKGSAKKYNEY